MTSVVLVNGRAVAPPTAGAVSALDRGFAYGDAVFEVLRAYRGRPFARSAHLDRLASGARALGIPPPDRAAWDEDLDRALGALDRAADAYVRLVLTRGAGLGVAPPADPVPTRVVVARAIERRRPAPRPACLVERPGRSSARYKTANYLPAVLAVRAAAGQEALLVDDRGLVTEAASANLFVVRWGVLLTPPDDGAILPGVTRRVVLDLARARGIPNLELPLTPAVVRSADEAFLTSSVRELVPLSSVDGAPVAAVPGPLTLVLRAAYERLAHGGAGG